MPFLYSIINRSWRRNALAFAFGICGTLSLPPFDFLPFIIPAYAGLLWLLMQAQTPGRHFRDGWWWGWGYHMTGLYWICIALLTDVKAFGWLIPFMLFGVTGVIALYPAMAGYAFGRLKRGGVNDIFLFCSIFTALEWLRGHLLSGFPWNLPGYAFDFSEPALQLASVFGAYGLTWCILLLGGCFAVLVIVPRRPAIMFIAVIWGLLGCGMVWGNARLLRYDNMPQSAREVAGVHLRLVQANIAQPHKWDPQLQMEGLRAQAHLTQRAGLEAITAVIWPETAVPYILAKDMPLLHLLGEVLPPHTTLLTGSLRAEGEGKNFRIWNSLMAINHGGEIVASYDKGKLVPFGEFLPLRSLLPKAWLTPVGDTDFSRGPGPSTVHLPGLPAFSPLICYEAIFPELAVNPADRPQFLLNITNDAWFGTSTGPYQHFAQARMRAVEQGLPLVRAANTGISAVTDGLGHITGMLPLASQGILDITLPRAYIDTIYARNGVVIMLFLLLIPLIVRLKRLKR